MYGSYPTLFTMERPARLVAQGFTEGEGEPWLVMQKTIKEMGTTWYQPVRESDVDMAKADGYVVSPLTTERIQDD